MVPRQRGWGAARKLRRWGSEVRPLRRASGGAHATSFIQASALCRAASRHAHRERSGALAPHQSRPSRRLVPPASGRRRSLYRRLRRSSGAARRGSGRRVSRASPCSGRSPRSDAREARLPRAAARCRAHPQPPRTSPRAHPRSARSTTLKSRRRGRDSNPRWAYDPCPLSKREVLPQPCGARPSACAPRAFPLCRARPPLRTTKLEKLTGACGLRAPWGRPALGRRARRRAVDDLASCVSARRSGRTSSERYIPRRASAVLGEQIELIGLAPARWGRVTEAAPSGAKSGHSAGPREALMQHRSSTLQQFAAQHRSSLTPSEAALWRLIRGGNAGVWFRRQVVVGRYIADFVAPRARLVIEVDGAYHARRRAADARRDRVIAKLGYRMLRLDAELILKRPEHALALIRAALSRGS